MQTLLTPLDLQISDTRKHLLELGWRMGTVKSRLTFHEYTSSREIDEDVDELYDLQREARFVEAQLAVLESHRD